MAGYTPNTTIPNTSAFGDSTSQSTDPTMKPSDTFGSHHTSHTGIDTNTGSGALGSSGISSLPPVGETRRDAGNPVSTTVGGHHDGLEQQHHHDDNKQHDESMASKMNPFRNKHNEPPSSMLTGEYVPGSGKMAGLSSGSNNHESTDLPSTANKAARSPNDDPSFVPTAGHDSSNITTATSTGVPSGMNAGGGIAGAGAAHDSFLGSNTSTTGGVPHQSGHNSGQGGDSTVGKMMQKAGEMMGSEKMQQKGQEKREQKGYDGPDVVSSTHTH